MRVFFDGEWICHRTWRGCGIKLPLKVISLSNKVLLHLTEDDLVWPDEERKLELEDVYRFLRIPGHRQYFFDLVCSEPALNPELQLVRYFDQEVHFGKVYTFIQRSCLRCPACQICCTRTGAHSLCSHGNFTHLWCQPQQHSGNDNSKRRKLMTIEVVVEFYINGTGLGTRFSDDEIQTELINIKEYYGITLPDGFNVR